MIVDYLSTIVDHQPWIIGGMRPKADRSDEGKTLFQRRLADVMTIRQLKTDKELARVIKRSPQVVEKWVNGKTKFIRAADLFAMADELKLNPRWFIEERAPMSVPTNGKSNVLTEAEDRFKLFLANKNPPYRELAEAFVRGIRALGPLAEWTGDVGGQTPRRRNRNGTATRTTKKDQD